MPRPVLVSQSCVSAPGLVTPAIHLHPHDQPTSVKLPFANAPEPSGICWSAPFRDGLPTPPSDMTGVAHNAIPSSNYGGQLNRASLHSYPPSSSRSALDPLPSAMLPSVKPQPSSASTTNSLASGPVLQKSAPSSSVAACPPIPASVRSSRGGLAEFAAQMTCLFWFESSAKLATIEGCQNAYASLGPDAVPSAGFQKWVTSILSTTQVGQNVVMLALLFIYRLKKFNTGVRGKRGSEFRLMTIALMLGNKFLDDNTYTNKTWAEVSGISVHEIHIMEVEFLSNVRYNLLASEAEWSQWQSMLGCFADYFNKASIAENDLAPVAQTLRSSPRLGPAPRMQSSSPLSKLPSPPMPGAVRNQPTFNFQLNGSSRTPQPHLGNGVPTNPRKRTSNEQPEERPAKRPEIVAASVPSLPPASALTSVPTLPPALTPTSAPADGSVSGVGSRLPCPNYPTSSSTLAPSIPTSVCHTPTAGRGVPVYNSTPTWAPPIPSTAAVPPAPNGLYSNPMSLPNPVRHQSPLGIPAHTASPALSAYSVHTPQTHLSPSFFLANRYSPYRPVRAVNTLLVPPPSGSMQQQRSVPFDHMHYQPLGRPPAERKTGLLPYAQREAWSHGPFIQPMYQANHAYSG